VGVSFFIGRKIKNKTHQITTKNKKYENNCIIFLLNEFVFQVSFAKYFLKQI
jgi:hypothetical protein